MQPAQHRVPSRRRRAGRRLRLAAYDRIIYLFPTNTCAWAGSRWGKRALLNGTLTVANTAHELGHTFGLPHAQAWSCAPRPCGVVNYGDPYDTMGSGTGDFDSYEKWLLGWITRVTRPSQPGVYTIAPIEVPSSEAQGLVVTTTRNRYWFEVRRDPARDTTGAGPMRAGLLVHAGPSPTIAPGLSSYGGLSNALILDPVGHGRPWLQAGDRFGEPGAFRIVVLGKIRLLVQTALRLDGHDAAQTADNRVSWSPCSALGRHGGDVARLERTGKRHCRIPDVDRRRTVSLDHAEHLPGVERSPNRGSAPRNAHTQHRRDRPGRQPQSAGRPALCRRRQLTPEVNVLAL